MNEQMSTSQNEQNIEFAEAETNNATGGGEFEREIAIGRNEIDRSERKSTKNPSRKPKQRSSSSGRPKAGRFAVVVPGRPN